MAKNLLSIIIFLTMLTVPIRAQWASVNIDPLTEDAVAVAFAASTLEESKITGELSKILKHYKSAGIASSGIFASKYLDRKALTKNGKLSDPRENFIYIKIKDLIVQEMFPRIVRVGKLCVMHPEEILTWGPYLYKCTEDIQEICKQFQCVVTNGRISFDDITFLTLADELLELVDLKQFANIDWETMFDDFGNFAKEIKKEDLMEDIKGLALTGSSLASTGGEIGSNLVSKMSSSGSIMDKAEYLYQAYDKFKTLYETASDPGKLQELFSAKLDSLGSSSIFSTKAYDISDYKSDYITKDEGTYYKQHWYIVHKDNSSGFLMTYIDYDELFDSYSMEYNTFMHRLNAKVDELNEMQTVEIIVDGQKYQKDEQKITYYLSSGDPIYYNESDEQRVKGSSSANFLLYCENSAKLGEGNFSWKENGDHNHGDVRDDSREYAMRSSLGEKPDLSTLDKEIERLTKERDALNEKIVALRSRYNEVYYLINSNQSSDKDALYKELKENEAEQDKLTQEAQRLTQSITTIQQQRQATIDDYNGEEDDTYRIPALMHELEGPYGINWNNEGKWENNDFIRRGTISNGTQVIFKARLSCVRDESHFLGIRTHRAILQVEWTLTANNTSSSESVGTIKFENGMDDATKSNLVNEKIHELNEDFPDCRVEVEYNTTDSIADESEDVLHLLWASDRIRVANDLYGRLRMINGQLIKTEFYLIHRQSLLTRIKNLLFAGLPDKYINTYARVCQKRWINVGLWIAQRKRPEDFEFNEKEEFEKMKPY